MKPPYPKYVICPIVKGLPNHLTAGKRYEVEEPSEFSFCIADDEGERICMFWEESPALKYRDWIIPENEAPEEEPEGDPPAWAMKLACDGAGLLESSLRKGWYSDATSQSIEAHARTIAKHEQEPADPDLKLAREIAARSAEKNNLSGTAGAYLAGEKDYSHAVTHALAAIKHIREHGLPE